VPWLCCLIVNCFAYKLAYCGKELLGVLLEANTFHHVGHGVVVKLAFFNNSLIGDGDNAMLGVCLYYKDCLLTCKEMQRLPEEISRPVQY
jgi:hypothetical protein